VVPDLYRNGRQLGDSSAATSFAKKVELPEERIGTLLVFKVYDSLTDGRSRWTAHTAFDDPTSPPDAGFRESIEIRTLAFF